MAFHKNHTNHYFHHNLVHCLGFPHILSTSVIPLISLHGISCKLSWHILLMCCQTWLLLLLLLLSRKHLSAVFPFNIPRTYLFFPYQSALQLFLYHLNFSWFSSCHILNDCSARSFVWFVDNNSFVLPFKDGPGSSVGIATDYGLDGPGSNPGEDETFRPSRPALGPTQSLVEWVPCLSWG